MKTKFEVYGHKIVDIKTGKIYAIELLARPRKNQIDDIESFFKTASKDELVDWFYYQVERAIRFYTNTGIRCTVNLDKHIFNDVNLDVLNGYQDNIIIEVTQVHELPERDEVFGLKHRYGANLFLDDFDWSVNDVETLDRYKFDGFKLDKEMIALAESRQFKDADILSKLKIIYAKSNKSNKLCIVEGVETHFQASVLRDIGFRYYQGYYFHIPEPLDHIEANMGKN